MPTTAQSERAVDKLEEEMRGVFTPPVFDKRRQNIVDAIAPKPGETVVEIGPGLAALTEPLLERCGKMQVVEIDRDLVARLRELGAVSVRTLDGVQETVKFPLPKGLRHD